MRWAKVEVSAPVRSRPIVLRVRDVRIAVERGFDPETLAEILRVLDGRPS